MTNLEKYFLQFRKNIVGIDTRFDTPYGEKGLVYADWIASGRLYGPIENKMLEQFGPLVGNTHTETNITGTTMTLSYHEAQKIIKKHVNAGPEDVIINAGFGMTTVVNKFQRIIGIKVCEQLKNHITLSEEDTPLVIITHMEHHSNHTSWLETLADVEIIEPDEEGLVKIENLHQILEKHKKRKLKIGSFTAASNVTGIKVDYHKMAKIMHQHGGLCFVDFAAAAPYMDIDMHPEDPEEKLDAIFFSPHKFLGGPGSAGVLVFDSKLYTRKIPDHPGGGTVEWTNPWGEHMFLSNIEAREDGGTPGFLQTIRTALCVRLKEKMGADKMLAREQELLDKAFPDLNSIPKLHILANQTEERLGIISFYIEDVHYNLIVKLLNDFYGIQVRGGCSCAGTYGHYLLHVDPSRSKLITDKIASGDYSDKPGWVRLSLHPTMTDKELNLVLEGLRHIIENIDTLSKDYSYDSHTNEFEYSGRNKYKAMEILKWFNL